MAKAKTKSPAAKSAGLTSEEFQKLSAEEQAAYVAKLQSENSELKAAAKEASTELPTFTVEKGGENYEAGEYQFQYPTFTWDDNSIINVHDLMADAEGEDDKVAQKASAIIAALVARQSGIVKRKED